MLVSSFSFMHVASCRDSFTGKLIGLQNHSLILHTINEFLLPAIKPATAASWSSRADIALAKQRFRKQRITTL